MAERRCSVSRQPFDRFIPFRPNLDVDSSYARIMSSAPSGSTPRASSVADCSQFKTPLSKEYTRLLSKSTPIGRGSILPIRRPPATSPFSKRMDHLFGVSPVDEGYDSPGKANVHRRIPASPECIMDMPGLRDDFYTNLLDWSVGNMIAVALHQSTYVWNAESKECQRIEIYVPDVTSGYYISALSWDTKDGNLAIAENKGRINVCDVEKMATSRQFDAWSEKCPVGVIRWTDYGLISGNRKGAITLHDMRTKHPHMVCLTSGSTREVCGLALSHGTSCLASGGDDGVVNLWDMRMMQKIRSITAHTACVKALAWCPWRQGVLATGGGTSDGHIRLWYAQSGDKLGEAFTRSQVCGLVWSEEYKELVSALGSATPDKNDLILWNMKNSEFDPVARLRHHMARPLHVALSPDHTTIATAGADESLCLWNTFPKRCSQRLWSPWDRSPLNPTSYIR